MWSTCPIISSNLRSNWEQERNVSILESPCGADIYILEGKGVNVEGIGLSSRTWEIGAHLSIWLSLATHHSLHWCEFVFSFSASPYQNIACRVLQNSKGESVCGWKSTECHVNIWCRITHWLYPLHPRPTPKGTTAIIHLKFSLQIFACGGY